MCNCDMGPSEKLTLISLNNFIRKAIVPAKDQDTLSVCYNPTRKNRRSIWVSGSGGRKW